MKKILKTIAPTALILSMAFSSTTVFAADFNSASPTPIANSSLVQARAHQFQATADLNVRATPSNSGTVTGWLTKGDIVWLDPEGESVTGWIKIYGYNSKGTYVNGYVGSQYMVNIS